MTGQLLRFVCLSLLAVGLMAQQKPVPPIAAIGDPFYAPVAEPGAQSFRDKTKSYVLITFGPKAVVAPLFTAAIRMANPPSQYPRDWKDGAGAFGKEYGSAMASRTAEYTARYALGALLHEDFRYRPSTSTNFLARGAHALAFTFVDRSDSGHSRLAVANFGAAAANGFVGNAYLPAGYNNVSHAGSRAAIAFAGIAGQNVLREFSPDLARLTARLHVPFPHVPIPDWWVKW